MAEFKKINIEDILSDIDKKISFEDLIEKYGDIRPVLHDYTRNGLNILGKLIELNHMSFSYDKVNKTYLTKEDSINLCFTYKSTMIQQLIKYGLNISLPVKLKEARNEKDPPIEISCILFCIENKHILDRDKIIELLIQYDEVKILIQQNYENPETCGDWLKTVCMDVNIKILEILLKYGPDITIIPHSNTKYSLLHCIRNDKILELLLSKGAEKYINDIDFNNNTPLHLIVKNYIHNTPGNTIIQTVNNIITHFSSIKNINDIFYKKNNKGKTALFNAIYEHNIKENGIADAFINILGIDINHQDIDGNTILFEFNSVHSFIYLNEKKANKELQNKIGDTPLIHYCKSDDYFIEIIKILKSETNINKQNLNGNTALIEFCRIKYNSITIATNLNILRELSPTPEIINIQNKLGNTCLHYFYFYQNKIGITELEKRGGINTIRNKCTLIAPKMVNIDVTEGLLPLVDEFKTYAKGVSYIESIEYSLFLKMFEVDTISDKKTISELSDELNEISFDIYDKLMSIEYPEPPPYVYQEITKNEMYKIHTTAYINKTIYEESTNNPIFMFLGISDNLYYNYGLKKWVYCFEKLKSEQGKPIAFVSEKQSRPRVKTSIQLFEDQFFPQLLTDEFIRPEYLSREKLFMYDPKIPKRGFDIPENAIFPDKLILIIHVHGLVLNPDTSLIKSSLNITRKLKSPLGVVNMFAPNGINECFTCPTLDTYEAALHDFTILDDYEEKYKCNPNYKEYKLNVKHRSSVKQFQSTPMYDKLYGINYEHEKPKLFIILRSEDDKFLFGLQFPIKTKEIDIKISLSRIINFIERNSRPGSELIFYDFSCNTLSSTYSVEKFNIDRKKYGGKTKKYKKRKTLKRI
jgi:ankyrin repeat protein